MVSVLNCTFEGLPTTSILPSNNAHFLKIIYASLVL